MQLSRRRFAGLLDRAVIGTVLFVVLLLVGVRIANAGEVVPAVGLTKSVNGDDNARLFGSLAVRGELLPILKTEIGVSYREENITDDTRLKLRMWPITASLWVSPFPAIYAGGGVGWYHTTYDYDQDRIPFPVRDETRQDFGLHLGGGVQVPVGPSVGLDLHGRYVMMREQDNRLIPQRFDPDFWMSSLGLAFKF